jgi:hypothetical protein
VAPRRGKHANAPVVLAAEAVRARLAAGLEGGNRQLVGSVLHRADEPGEMLAYWTSRYGRTVPKPVKRGIADAVARLYDERLQPAYAPDLVAGPSQIEESAENLRFCLGDLPDKCDGWYTAEKPVINFATPKEFLAQLAARAARSKFVSIHGCRRPRGSTQ